MVAGVEVHEKWSVKEKTVGWDICFSENLESMFVSRFDSSKPQHHVGLVDVLRVH